MNRTTDCLDARSAEHFGSARANTEGCEDSVFEGIIYS